MKKIFLLLFIFFSIRAFALEKDNIFPDEGVFNKNISISVESNNEIFFYFENSISKDPIPYNQQKYPLLLSAAEGELKKYIINFIDKTDNNKLTSVQYIIDKERPPVPKISFDNNFITFKKEPFAVFYRSGRGSWLKWNEEKIYLSEINTVFYYSEDSAGNRSRINSWSYNEKGDEISSKMYFKILNPVPGQYYNKQLLHIDHSGYDWIKFSIKNKESSINGTLYKDPVLIDKTGDITVYTAAKPIGSETVIFNEITYNVFENKSAVQSELLNSEMEKYISASSSKIILYSLNEPDNYTRYEKPVKLISENFSKSYNAVYFKNFDDLSDRSYRYFYVFDNRIADNQKAVIKITNEKKYPVKPVLEGIKKNDDGGKQILLKQNKNLSFIFNLKENSLPDNPDLNSTVSDSIPELKNPYGRDSDYFIKVSSIDKENNISQPLIIRSLKIDHYPPNPPEISFNSNILTFNSNLDVYYRIMKSPDWIKYSEPLSLKSMPGISEISFIEYYTVDDSANKSIIRKEELVFNNTFPEIKDISELKTNNLSNKDIRVSNSFFNSDYDIYYTISGNSSLPINPDRNSEKLIYDLILKAAEGSEKYYSLKVLPVSKINGNRGDIKTFHFHIDKIKPALPDLSDLKNIYYSDHALLNIKGSGSANTIYYSYSFNENNLKSPFEGEKTTEKAIVITNNLKERKTCFMKIGCIDNAGNRNTDKNIYKFIIDNRDYPLINFNNLSDKTITDKTVKIYKPDDEYIYRYEIRNIRNTEANVSYSSDIINKELIFNAFNNEEKTFFLYVKVFFDEFDKKGSSQKLYYIKTDRKKPGKPQITISESNLINLKSEYPVFYSAYPESIKYASYKYNQYDKPFKLNSYIPPGRYNINAYSKDSAGNLSDISTDSFYISKKAVFVSEKQGNDSNTGVDNNNAFKTAEKAFSYIKNNSIDTIIFSEGNYSLESPKHIDKTLLLKGMHEKTFFSDSSKNIDTMFQVSDSALLFKDINITSSNYKESIISSENSLIVLDNSFFSVNTGILVDITKGNLIIEDSEIQTNTGFSSISVKLKNSSLSISDSSFNLSSGGDLKGFVSENSSSVIKNTSFTLRSESISFFQLNNSIINTYNTKIRQLCRNSSVFFKADNSRINLNNSFFSDASGGLNSIFINSDNSKINLNKISINLNSINKSAFIDDNNGEYNIMDSLAIINNSYNSIPVINTESGIFNINNSDFTLENTINGGYITAVDSIFEIYKTDVKNTVKNYKYLMDFSGIGSLILKNNKFTSEENLLKSSKNISVLKTD